jgi:hypothetical protein
MVNYCKPAERRLNRDEIVTALKQIAAKSAGTYTLKALFGDAWSTEPRPRAFGKWFKASVMAGDLPGLRWVRKRSDMSHEYEVLPRVK